MNAADQICFRFECETTLAPLWFDEGWFATLIQDGMSEREALTEMLRAGWAEDWSSIVEEMVGDADSFAAKITAVTLVRPSVSLGAAPQENQ